MTIYLGIDPGLSGALAWYKPEVGMLVITDMPTLEIKTSGKMRRQLDLYKLAKFFDEEWLGEEAQAIIEDVGAMPGQGVSSMFKFGFVAGALQAFAASQFIPMHLVRPAVWKKALGLTGDKDASRRLASQLMPAHAHLWPLVKHDGRAEAALLAYYGAKFL